MAHKAARLLLLFGALSLLLMACGGDSDSDPVAGPEVAVATATPVPPATPTPEPAPAAPEPTAAVVDEPTAEPTLAVQPTLAPVDNGAQTVPELPDVIPTPVIVTDLADPEAEVVALDVYDEWQQSLVYMADPPDPDHPGIAQLSTDGAQQWSSERLQTMVDDELRAEGTVTTSPVVGRWLNPTALVILDCFLDESVVVDNDGEVVQPAIGVAQKREAVLVQGDDGVWRVRDYFVFEDPCEQ